MTTVLRGKFMALNAYIKNVENVHTIELIAHLKALSQKEADSLRRSRHQEIIELRAEINKLETKRAIQRINKTESWFFEKTNKIDKALFK